ncbi:MAG TPA: prephenate dehydratase domain-containing protein, partial [Solirubrobacterales bacterium]|nr:prephenate dehydratase domain-containing protein [Solirubrobacterales bacterium]
MRVSFLGPAGTFTEDALREASPPGGGELELVRMSTVHDAILAVERGESERAFVPFENSIEGSVRSTLDTLALETENVTIVGEHDFRVHAHLIAREGVELEDVAAVLSHPQPLGQCAGFLRERLPGVERRSVSSTAEAVRMVGESVRPWAAIGARAAAELYGCVVLREGIEDEADNVTRFVWIAPSGT